MPIVSNQVELAVNATGALRDGSLDHAQQHGYSPTRIRVALEQVGSGVGLSVGATALAWVLRHPSSPVAVLGTMNPERMSDLATAVGVPLERHERFRILEAAQEGEVL